MRFPYDVSGLPYHRNGTSKGNSNGQGKPRMIPSNRNDHNYPRSASNMAVNEHACPGRTRITCGPAPSWMGSVLMLVLLLTDSNHLRLLVVVTRTFTNDYRTANNNQLLLRKERTQNKQRETTDRQKKNRKKERKRRYHETKEETLSWNETKRRR